MIIEFKRVYEDETPETVLEGALQRIRENRCITELGAAGISLLSTWLSSFAAKVFGYKRNDFLFPVMSSSILENLTT
jgi:hypothetical protein